MLFISITSLALFISTLYTDKLTWANYAAYYTTDQKEDSAGRPNIFAGQWTLYKCPSESDHAGPKLFDMSFSDFWSDLNETEQNDLAGPKNNTN